MHMRYADAGVDISRAEQAKERIRRMASRTFTRGVVGGIGAFGGLFALDVKRWREPVLVSSTDGVGTKLKIAAAMGIHSTVGGDLVNHCVNDILCCGAEPLFFLDYYATGKLVPEHLAELIEGIAEACRAAGCALIGGETAEMPGVYALGDYDIAGFIVGSVERDKIIDGSRVQAGDQLYALPSSGLHTNGYSLVRHIVAEHELQWSDVLPGTEQPLVDLLLEPHRAYLHAIREMRTRTDIHAMAHITGGGVIDNVPRVLPEGLAATIDRSTWNIPALFTAIQEAGAVHLEEMWRTFNMGVGMVVIVPAGAPPIDAAAGIPVWRIGEVVPQTGPRRVVLQ
ncbi:MAG: phosphoribosylformylglycinamidine cyclo-ligase [Candidatus Dormiibacterota bacterium]